MIRTISLALFLCVTLPSSSWATTGYEGFHIITSFNVNASKQNNNDTGIHTEETVKIMSTRIGYTLKGGFYLGVIDEAQDTNNGSDTLKTTHKGGSVGISQDGSYIIYHSLTESKTDIDALTSYSGKGSGMDFGHHFQVGDTLSIGAQLSFRTLEFDRAETDGITSKIDVTTHWMRPMITFGLTF